MPPPQGLKRKRNMREILIEDKLIPEEQLKAAEETAKKESKHIQVVLLEQKVKELADERERLEKEKNQLDEAQRTAVAAMQATQQTLAGLRKEVEGLRDEVRAVRKDRFIY